MWLAPPPLFATDRGVEHGIACAERFYGDLSQFCLVQARTSNATRHRLFDVDPNSRKADARVLDRGCMVGWQVPCRPVGAGW